MFDRPWMRWTVLLRGGSTVLLPLVLAACSSVAPPPPSSRERCVRGDATQCESALQHPVDHAALKPRCDAGEFIACFELGNAYLNGTQVERDVERGRLLLARACEGDLGVACGLLGSQLYQDRDLDPAPANALAMLEKGCTLGDARSCLQRGKIYESGAGLPDERLAERFEQAASFYRRACDLKLGRGCEELGMLHHQGLGIREGEGSATSLFKRACELDPTSGCMGLALAYTYGDGVTKDVPRARELFTQLCEGGEAEACQALVSLALETKPTNIPGTLIAMAAHGERFYVLAKEGERRSLWDLDPSGKATSIPLASPEEGWSRMVSDVEGNVWLASGRAVARMTPDGKWRQVGWGDEQFCYLISLEALRDGRVVALRAQGADCWAQDSGVGPPSEAQLEKIYRDQLYLFMKDARYEGQLLTLRINDRDGSTPLWRQWEAADGIARALRKGKLTLEAAAALAEQKLGASRVTLGPIQLVENQTRDLKLEQALERARPGALVGPIESSGPTFGGRAGTLRFAVWTQRQPVQARPFKEVRDELVQRHARGRPRHEVVVVDRELKLSRRALIHYGGLDLQVVPLADGFVVLGDDKLQLNGSQWREDSPLLRAVGQWPVSEAVEWGEQLLVRSQDGSSRLLGRDGKVEPLLPSSSGSLTPFPTSPERFLGLFADIGPSGLQVSEYDRTGRRLSLRKVSPPGAGLSCGVTLRGRVVVRPDATWVLCERAIVRVGKVGATLYQTPQRW